ncbi:hypothetical protein SAMN05421847_1296 [Halpernia humi]|uniref:Uncharacterized protein n=1 Tax=Halpernia humi TaxID=493375 RepID=A0A1H5WQD8_9FLAO|nr:hypothetical protein [Halpernia humi]SEG01590.1 hypothetical protein SAMN05421847_1296 [Halpernia humi]
MNQVFRFIAEYWSQITVVIGVIGFIVKTLLDYKIKIREHRSKYFYEIKAKKILELYDNLIKIQIIIDRKSKGEFQSFEQNIFAKRKELDKYYWESSLYLSNKTKHSFDNTLKMLKLFESKGFMTEFPKFEKAYQSLIDLLKKEFKNQIR